MPSRTVPSGYAHFLHAITTEEGEVQAARGIADPDDPERAELLEWVGGSFDADDFDVREVAERLALGTMLDW